MKKLCSLILALCLLLLPVSVSALEIPFDTYRQADVTHLLHDLADLFSEEEEKALENALQDLKTEMEYPCVLLTAEVGDNRSWAENMGFQFLSLAGNKGFGPDGMALVLGKDGVVGAASRGSANAGLGASHVEETVEFQADREDHSPMALANAYIRAMHEIKRAQENNLPLPVVYDYASIDPAVKIHDDGALMTDEEEAALEEQALQFAQRYGLDIAVVTVSVADSETEAMHLADDLYDYAGGKGFSEDGLLLLIDMVNRKYWISTKGEAISIFWDEDIDWMKSVLVPKLQRETPAATAEAFLCASEQVCTARLAEMTGNKEVYVEHFHDYSGHWDAPRSLWGMLKKHIWILLAVTVIGGLAVGVFYYTAGKAKHRPVHEATEAGNYVSQPFKLDVCNDLLINRYVSKRARPKETSSSSGGGGGGGSFHSSSSGSSHGGGGGSF